MLPAQLQVTYLANEGIWIRGDQFQVIIDGFVKGNPYGYDGLPATTLSTLEQASDPFNGPTLILVTHLHSDHFTAASIARHLQNNPAAVVVASNEVIRQIVDSDASVRRSQLIGRTPTWSESQTVTFNGLTITCMRMRHSWYKNYNLEHLGFVVDFGDIQIAHLGDIETNDEDFKPFLKELQTVDYAFIPFWLMMNDAGSTIVKSYFDNAVKIGIHMPGNKASERTQVIRKTFPNARVFSKPMLQTFTLN